MIDLILEDVKQKYIDRPKRFKHILGVVQTAVSLATRYGVDTKKAYIAALFHDFTKYDTLDDQLSVLTPIEIKTYKDYPVMYHALSAAKILRSKYHIEDEEILNAISRHVWGDLNMTLLDKIILIADKTEPSRNYPVVTKLRKLSKENLDKTLIVYYKDALIHYEKKGIQAPPIIKDIIKELGVK